MKKTVFLMLPVMLLVLLSTPAYAATTFAFDKTVGWDRTSYSSGDFYFNEDEIEGFNFSYIKRIKIDLEYLKGYYSGDKKVDFRCFNPQIGLPIINQPELILYITLGKMDFYEDTNIKAFEAHDCIPEHETDGKMWGIDLVVIPNNNFQIEVNFQRSFSDNAEIRKKDLLWGTIYSEYYENKLTIYKIKFRYLLTDNLGLTFNHRLLQNICQDFSQDDVKLKFWSMGFVYRF